MKPIAHLLLSALLLGGLLPAAVEMAPGRGADAKEPPLQGVWSVESFKSGAKDSFRKWLYESARNGKVVITADQITFAGEERSFVIRYKTDPNKSPKEIDLTDDTKNVTLGIYQVDESLLIICFATRKGIARPSKFELKADSDDYVILVLRRKTND